ncbi:hypothetical protein [Caproiciproducens sp.]
MKRVILLIISLIIIIVSISGCNQRASNTEVEATTINTVSSLSTDVKEVVLEWLSSADDFINSNKFVSDELYNKTVNIANDTSNKYTSDDKSIITDCQALYIKMFTCGTSTDETAKLKYKQEILVDRNNIAKKIGEKTK